ncbi:MAG TPA: acyltransferase [Candidatus Limnocylindria bacterium]|jgi:peptidoglycan/LPS O-acetylase OafA/YrhL|nr:acyltransferase [Candidatus Limnocylindria bacterium]
MTHSFRRIRRPGAGNVAKRGPSIKQFRALTGLRAFAALWVVVYHLKDVGGHFHSFGVFDPIVRYGAFGVDVFFVLSGFILTHVYASTFTGRVSLASYGAFLQNRIARVYPLHIATLAIMLLLYLASRQMYHFVPERAEAYSPFSIAANLTLTQAWFSGVWAPNTPAWSISAEWFAYLLFPLAVLGLTQSRLWVQAAIIPLALGVIAVSTPMRPLVQISAEFTIGMGTYLLWKRLRHESPLVQRVGRFTGLAAIGLIVASLYAFQHPAFWFAALFSAVLIASLATEHDVLVPLLSAGWVVYLGEISYSIYMCQWFIWSLWRRGLPRIVHHHIPDLVLMGTACLAIVGAAALAYHYVEVPGRRWLRRGFEYPVATRVLRFLRAR